MLRIVCGVVLVSAIVAGCGGGGDKDKGGDGPAAKTASVKIDSRDGSKITGTATFTEKDGKVTFEVSIEGASPGPHAVHIHEHGDCSAPDAKSAGGHWNPTKKAHGKWGEGEFHLGDIGNIEVKADGKGSLKLVTDLWSVGSGKENDVVGKSIVIHEKGDDFKTQPTGDAGKRFGCGVIEIGK